MPRLQKVLAAAGVASRRQSEELIRQGRVTVDRQVVLTPGRSVDPERQIIAVDGKPLRRESRVYLMLNKPVGVVSTVTDPLGRPAAVDLVREVGVRVHPVGRLDVDTEGLLLLTNDGDLTLRLTHPRYEVVKVYEAEVQGRPNAEALRRLQRGVELEDGVTAPAEAEVVWVRGGRSLVRLALHTGKKRQVRRMLKAVGHPAARLRRTHVDGLSLGRLLPGTWRRLRPEEVARLWAAGKAPGEVRGVPATPPAARRGGPSASATPRGEAGKRPAGHRERAKKRPERVAPAKGRGARTVRRRGRPSRP
jgi:23S rRNA pseudouridine2605 synthase